MSCWPKYIQLEIDLKKTIYLQNLNKVDKKSCCGIRKIMVYSLQMIIFSVLSGGINYGKNDPATGR